MNGERVDYIYDGLQAVAEVAADQQVGLLTGLGLDEVIARYSPAGGRYYLTDALNTVIAQTRADRSIQNVYVYSSYGEVNSLGEDEGNPIQYTARENDRTGLYYYRARYYDPKIGRFISEDPAEDGANLYAYVANSPVNYVDPWGLYDNIFLNGTIEGRLLKAAKENNYTLSEAGAKSIREAMTDPEFEDLKRLGDDEDKLKKNDTEGKRKIEEKKISILEKIVKRLPQTKELEAIIKEREERKKEKRPAPQGRRPVCR